MLYGLDNCLVLQKPPTRCTFCDKVFGNRIFKDADRILKGSYCTIPCMQAARLEKVAKAAGTVCSPWYIGIAAILAVFMLVFTFTGGHRAWAHDPHTHHADAFSKAKSKKGNLCCDGNDYTYVSPSSWERTETGFRVYVQKQWVDIPADALVTNMTNPDGEAKVWLYTDGGKLHARCFMAGTES